MRSYKRIPDETWVTCQIWINHELVEVVGFVLKYNEGKGQYWIFIPELGHVDDDDAINVPKYRLKDYPIDADIQEEKINFTLDMAKDERLKPYCEEWFMELSKGEVV